MRVEAKSLVLKMNRYSTQALEAAVGNAARGRFYEITVQHLLMALFEQKDNDVEDICKSLGIDRRTIAIELQRNLNKMRTGNEDRPVFSETMFNWIESAWLIASVNQQAHRVRTGDLLLEYLSKPERYSAKDLDSLARVNLDELRKLYPEQISREASTALAPSGEPGQAEHSPGQNEGSPEREALDRFCVSFTDQAKTGRIDPIFGRDKEIRQVIDILSRRRKNNPIIVGEPGVGKTALVEGLALAIAQDEVPLALRNTEILSLDLGLLKAGAGVKGELEDRLKRVIAQVKCSTTPIVLFIDEVHSIMGDKGEMADLLKPELARGELKTIAATTWAEFKKYFEKDAALERRFQPVKVDQPSVQQAVTMLRGLAARYEQAHQVIIRDAAIEAAVELSDRYITGRQLPDKAVDLLDTAAARVKIEREAPPMALVQAKSTLTATERTLAALVRDKREGAPTCPDQLARIETEIAAARDSVQEIHASWDQAKEALRALKSAQDALRDCEEAELSAAQSAVANAREHLRSVQGEVPLLSAEVDPGIVARVVADWTGIPVGKMQRSTLSNLLEVESQMQGRIRGQDQALLTVAQSVQMAYAGVRDPNTPIAVLLFAGPSGVGKTETVLTLADTLYGGDNAVTTINMSEFQEKHTVSRLVGSPPGYVGYGEGGVLTEAVRKKPYSVVLLDECEKADLEVMNLFYQVFDKGTLADGEGREIDFRNTVIVLTSNLGSERITQMHARGNTPTHEELVEAITPELTRHFKPALLGRMTIVPYRPLPAESLAQISRLKLDRVAQRICATHDLEVRFDPAVYDYLADRCSQAQSGARLIDQVLRATMMPALAKAILGRLTQDELGAQLRIGLNPDQQWTFAFCDAPKDSASR